MNSHKVDILHVNYSYFAFTSYNMKNISIVSLILLLFSSPKAGCPHQFCKNFTGHFPDISRKTWRNLVWHCEISTTPYTNNDGSCDITFRCTFRNSSINSYIFSKAENFGCWIIESHANFDTLQNFFKTVYMLLCHKHFALLFVN